MTYRVALNFEDGATRFIDCNDGEKVLDAAYRNKINLPMDCSDGVCGTCKCRCEQGEYDLRRRVSRRRAERSGSRRGDGADLPDGGVLGLRHRRAGAVRSLQGEASRAWRGGELASNSSRTAPSSSSSSSTNPTRSDSCRASMSISRCRGRASTAPTPSVRRSERRKPASSSVTCRAV